MPRADRCATRCRVLDQAIAYGAGEVRELMVRTMLGAVDTEYMLPHCRCAARRRTGRRCWPKRAR